MGFKVADGPDRAEPVKMAGAEHEVGVTHCCELALSNWQEKALAPLSHSAVTAAMPCFGPLALSLCDPCSAV